MSADLTNTLQFANNLIMFYIGRSGSSVLSIMLKQNSRISWAHEVFRPDLKKKHFEEFSTRDPAHVLRNIMEQSKQGKPGSTYFGFESQLPQVASLGLDLDAYIGMLREMNFQRIIVLKRRNHLRRIVSSLLGHMTTRWYRKVDENIPVIHFNMDIHSLEYHGRSLPLIEHLHLEQRHFQTLEGLSRHRNVLQLTYEDDIEKDPREGYQRVCEFIGVEAADVRVPWKRSNPFKLSELVTNYQELEAYLAGSQFEWMVDA